MTKLAFFALIFTALVAFSVVSAIRTPIITTSIEDVNMLPADGRTIEGLDGVDNGVLIDLKFIDGLHNGKRFGDGIDNTAFIDLRYIDGLHNLIPVDFHFIDGLENKIDWPYLDSLHNAFPASSRQCGRQIPIEQLNHCKMAVRAFPHRQEQHLQQCCSQLKRVSEQCQCAVIQQAFNKAWQEEGGLQKVSHIASKAYELPNYCGLKVRDCPLKVPRV